MKYFFIAICLLVTFSIDAQREIIMSQYMYNRYNINPAFGGSHDVMSVFGSYRKQWMGFEESPASALFTIHSPLKNEKVGLGAQIFNESYAIASNTGFNISYAYRMALKNNKKLALGVSAGYINYKSNWGEADVVDMQDPAFAATEQTSAPLFGFGAALYDSKFFAGVSVPTFLYHDRFITGDNSVDFNKIDYLVTAGYLFELSENVSVQPSALLRVNLDQKTFVDVSATAILLRSLMIGASYRTVGDIVGILGYQITPQFRFTYSLDYSVESIGSYNNGTHEVALQFDFGYKINSPNPKFF